MACKLRASGVERIGLKGNALQAWQGVCNSSGGIGKRRRSLAQAGGPPTDVIATSGLAGV
ncbi:MAG: hypothetical protein ACE5JL_06960 [Dehalococcoidia bacterium]